MPAAASADDVLVLVRANGDIDYRNGADGFSRRFRFDRRSRLQPYYIYPAAPPLAEKQTDINL